MVDRERGVFGRRFADLINGDPDRSISTIKNAVVARLGDTDRGAMIETTDYFNHSYVPDMIVRWADDHVSRKVFLRTNADPAYLREDVDTLRNDHPIIIPLAEVRQEDIDTSDSQLQEESQGTSTLIADPDSFSAIEEEKVRQPVVALFARAMLQGGRGLVGTQLATEASRAVGEGFDAARAADTDRTGRAVRVAEDLLDNTRSINVTRLLRAIWVGSGAPASTFPGAENVPTSIDAASLDFLLGIENVPDLGFWRRLGTSLTLERVCQLRAAKASDNLQQLIRANLDRLRAKSCQMAEPDLTDGALVPMRWIVEHSRLVLQATRFRAFFSPSPASDIRPSDPSSDPLPVAEVQSRAARAEIALSEMDLVAEDRQLTYKAEGDADISQDAGLNALSEALGSDVTVRTAWARLYPSRHLRCDFTYLDSSGKTNAKFSLDEMGTTAIPLLVDLADDELAALRDALTLDASLVEDSTSPGLTDDFDLVVPTEQRAAASRPAPENSQRELERGREPEDDET